MLVAAYAGWRLAARQPGQDFLACYLRFDGEHYERIARSGYTDPTAARSALAFFPAYPVAGRAIAILTGANLILTLVAASNLLLLGTFIVLGRYLGARRNSAGAPHGTPSAAPPRARLYTLSALAAVPCGLFFHIAYTEASFLFLAVLFLLAVERRWPVTWIALVVGLCTATRPVGVALLVPFFWHLRFRSAGRREYLISIVILLPLACWGLLAYMFYQWTEFGSPFIFATTQEGWRTRPAVPLGEKVLSLASLEPIWSVYFPGSTAYWGGSDWGRLPWLDLKFMNPIFFTGTAVLVAIGAWKRWLSNYEILLSVPLLAIPYVTKGYDNAMISHGRFAAVVFPAYIVAGELLARLPRWAAWSIIGASAALFAAYSFEWAAGKPFF